MDDDTGSAIHEEPEPDTKSPVPVRAGWGFYTIMGIIALLVFLVLFFNLPATEAAASVTLTHTDWILTSYANSTGILVPVLTGVPVSLQFATPDQLAGSAGCNRYHAACSITGDSLNITGLISTQMYCPASVVMTQESGYLFDLQRSSRYRIRSTELYLYEATGRLLLVFAPAGTVP
jgi:heat shock protein HslJ